MCKIVSVHPYCASKLACDVMHRARALSTKMNNDKADGHCYSRFSCDVIITCPFEVSVPSDKRPYRILTFHKVLEYIVLEYSKVLEYIKFSEYIILIFVCNCILL